MKIKSHYTGHSISVPTEIKKLLEVVKCCNGPTPYRFAALTNYLDDIVGLMGSSIYICPPEDLKDFPKQSEPFIFVHSQISKKERNGRKLRDAKEGEIIKFKCGCTFKLLPISQYPDHNYKMIISGHNIDER